MGNPPEGTRENPDNEPAVPADFQRQAMPIRDYRFGVEYARELFGAQTNAA